MNLIITAEGVECIKGADDFLESVAKAALDACGVDEDVQISLLLCTDAQIKAINNEFRAIDKPTDVLSFPMLQLTVPVTEGLPVDAVMVPERDPESGEILLGDIVISTETAKRQSQEYGHSLERELGYLMVHGMLHILGYDHMHALDKKTMRQAEETILDALGLCRED